MRTWSDGGMTILSFATPLLSSNMYLLVENRRGIIIDPYDAPEFVRQVSEACDSVDYILLTHEHYDHISGSNALRERYGCPVLCSEICGQRIRNPAQNLSRYQEAYMTMQTGEPVSEDLLPIEEYVTYADKIFSGQQELLWEGHTVQLTETPGHSPGSICILVDGKLLFSGDSLLADGVAITRFPGGSRKQYEQITLPYLRGLSRDIPVYPGHYGVFRLGEHPAICESDKTGGI